MHHEVTDTDSAVALGSGDVPVLATPRLIAWMEAATVREARPLLTEDQTTVGVSVRVDHVRATPLGGVVNVTATPPIEAAGRRLTFSVLAVDGAGRIVARGEIERAIVERARFVAGLTRTATDAGAGTDAGADRGAGGAAGGGRAAGDNL